MVRGKSIPFSLRMDDGCQAVKSIKGGHHGRVVLDGRSYAQGRFGSVGFGSGSFIITIIKQRFFFSPSKFLSLLGVREDNGRATTHGS